jgi:hypothetical protein
MEQLMNLASIAELAHEANRSYCILIGDNSQKPWNEAPEWQKESAIDGVKFHIANPNAAPSQSHDNWLEHKRADGWKYGPIKNEKLKEHPCFCPYHSLPISQQIKDYIFRSVVHAAAVVNARKSTHGGAQ